MMMFFQRLRKLLNPLPFAMIASLFLAIFVHYWGHRMGMRGVYPVADEPVRSWVIFALLGLSLICAICLLYRTAVYWQARKTARQQRPLTVEETETRAMGMIFDRVSRIIRKRWTGEGNALTALPWYFVMGAAGSGKTALIAGSALRLPIDHEIKTALDDLKDHEAARLAAWHVAGNEAVLIELPGRYFTGQDEKTPMQRLLWQRFLENLQRVRPRRPLNGVVVTVDFLDFVQMDAPVREAFGLRLRHVVDDLVDRLDTRITLYVVFTKIDLIAGFTDFFENLPAAEKEALFGFQFALEKDGAWAAQFEAQYDAFVKRLQRILTVRLHDLKGTESRQEAFGFVRTLIGVQKNLYGVLTGSLQPDKFSMPPLLRGIYFAAPHPENAPHNVFLEMVGERYHLPVPRYAVPQGRSQPYFAGHILKDAVFGEAGLAGFSRRAEQRYKRMAALLGSGVAAGALIASVYWLREYQDNHTRAEAVLARVEDYAVRGDQKTDPANILNSLNIIRAATFEFGDYRKVNKAVAQVTLYKGHDVGPLADSAYQTLLHRRYMPQLVAGVEQRLANVCQKGSDEELNLLRILKMLGAPEHRNIPVIEGYFRDVWQGEFPNNAKVQAKMAEHLDYALGVDPQPYAIDAVLVRKAQADLSRLTPYRRFYLALQALALRQLPNALEFRSAVGATFDLVYTAHRAPAAADPVQVGGQGGSVRCAPDAKTATAYGPFEIERFFTRAQFHGFFVPQMQQVSKVALDDLWILGEGERIDHSDADLEQVAQKLRELYVEDYIRAWRDALNNMEVRRFNDLRDAGEILRGLSGVDSPIRRIAALVKDNTEIYPPETVAPDQANGATQLQFDPNREAGLRINEEFRAIHRMLVAEGGASQPNIDQIEEALRALHDYVKTVRDAPDPNAKALEIAIARTKLQGNDPIYVVQRLAERTPAPFDRHLRHVAQESWRVIMAAATEELNRKWHDEIYGEYQRLIAGKYPFDRQSPDDLPVNDFEDFFGPDGTLEKFYKTELVAFVDETTGQPRDIDGQSLPVDPDFAANLRRAITITRTFFNDTGDLSIDFTVQPMGLSANLARAQLNFEGQLVIATHGAARPVRIVWPNIIEGQTASRIDMSPLARSSVPGGLQFNGPWSWLRLYDSAAKSAIADNSVDISFSNTNGQTARFRIRAEGQVNPFFNSPLNGFTLPDSLRRMEDK